LSTSAGSCLFDEFSRRSVVAMARKKTSISRPESGYDVVLADVVALIEAGRRAAVRTSNVIMTATYWGVGDASSRRSSTDMRALTTARS